MPQDKILNQLADMYDTTRNNLLMNTEVSNTVGTILNSVEGRDTKLEVENIKINPRHEITDIAAQKIVRNRGQIWGDEIRADLKLVDKLSGKVVDHVKNIKVANVPKLTDRGTYLIGGNEYQFMTQARLKPGVYTRTLPSGEISSFFNIDKTIDFERGFNNNFRITFNPENKMFMMTYGSKNIPLISALQAVGATRDEIVSSWGREVYDVNSKAREPHTFKDQIKLYQAIFGKLPDRTITHEKMIGEIKDRLFSTSLDPEVTKITLDKAFDAVNKESLMTASNKIIKINKGEAEPDDREALVFKSFYGPEDHIRERLIKNSKKIISSLQFKLDKTRSINKSLSTNSFDPYVVGVITRSQLSSPPNQTNIMSIIGDNSKMTIMGEGGIGSANAITNEARQISNTEAGFIDPLHTPEGGNIGVTVHTSIGTVKIGNDLYGKFLTPNGKKVLLRPLDVYDKNIAFPDEVKKDEMRVVNKGKLKTINLKDVHYSIPSHIDMFDTSVNTIPFLNSIQGNRGLTASKIQEQALSLKNREEPLFDVVDKNGKSLYENIGTAIGVPKAPIDGIVKKITDDYIVITGKDKKDHTIQMYNNFSLNSESFLHNESLVKPGDKVKTGDVLADSNFTKNKRLALGTNLRVAYIPFKGYNYEDSAILSESAAKKLTSQHMYDFKTKRSSEGVFSKNKFKAYYPEELKTKNAAKLDKDGVAQIGQVIEPGDIVIAHMERKIPTADDIAVGRLDKQMKRDMANNALKWNKEVNGVVTNVEKHGNSVVVSVKTEEPLKVADKISGLHGNKHIVSKIIPDDQMPYNPITGERIDLTMSPLGVSNRINTSQLLESAAGKIGAATGKPYKILNFSGEDNTRKVLDNLKKAGLSDKDILMDPETGKPFKNSISNGLAHILKLEHIVDHKFSARYRDGHDSNEQPTSGGETGGKNLGRMEFAALLARGANENLREMFQIKGQRNDEYWKAMETGQALPPPKRAFVWDKMLAMMNGAGINVEQKGKTFQLKPMTDNDILKLSSGEIKDPTLTYRRKDLAPMKNGLFDPSIVGGLQGDNFTHFKLPEKILNPINATAAATLVGLTVNKLEDIIVGKQFVNKMTNEIVDPGTPNSISGGPAVEHLLSQVNINRELKNAEERVLDTRNPSELNKQHRKIRYLKALKGMGLQPTDYMISNVLVTPSKFRPMFAMGIDKTIIMSDANDLYQQTGFTVEATKSLKAELDKSVKDEDVKNLHLADIRGEMYKNIKAIAGLGEPTAYLHKVKNKKGFISQIDGGETKQTKEGFFQDKVMERRQDLVGRSTLILNPELGGDEIGIPKDMAKKMFQPFVMRKLVGLGYTPLEAQKQINDKTSIFDKALELVTNERLVIANRAPTLHQWNMIALKPKLTEGKSIEMPSIILSRNLGADVDGDCCLGGLYISLKINDLCKQFEKVDFDLFFYEKEFDTNIKNTYITSSKQMYSFLKSLEVNMPCLNNLPVNLKDKSILHINIENFPRIKDSVKITPNGNEIYQVPDGISVFTIDNETHDFLEIPVTEFSVHKNLSNYIVSLSDKNTLLLSNDQSAIAINTETFNLERVTPENLKGRAIPKLKKINIEPSLFEIKLIDYSTNSTVTCKESICLTEDVGHFIGIMIGNGWIADDARICMTSVHPEIKKSFNDTINKMMNEDIGIYSIDSPHSFDGYDCFSTKHTKTSTSLANNIKEWIGHRAKNKHLPLFFMSTSEEFRLGLLSGLIDTDGSSTWAKSKGKKEQYILMYSTTSPRLAEEIITLSRTLGISASFTPHQRNTCIEYSICFSTQSIVGKKLNLKNPDKRTAFEKFQTTNGETSVAMVARLDLVPFSSNMFIQFKKYIKSTHSNPQLYCSMFDSLTTGCIARTTAKKIIKELPDGIADQRWINIINNNNITWVYAKSLTLNKETLTMYDITAPGPCTFMLNNGIIVFDTLQLYTPISSRAIKEAERMKPSSSMLKIGYDKVLNAPQMDIVIGAWLTSKGKGGQDTKLKFDNIKDARDLFKNHKLTYADTVTINGIKAPYGMHEINDVIPDESKKWNIELNQKNVDDWINEVVKKHNGKMALGLADKMKEIGNNYVTTYGFTIGLSDTASEKEIRDPIINETIKKTNFKDPSSIIGNFSQAVDLAEKKIIAKHGENSMTGVALQSGGGKNFSNTSSITLMPGIVMDANNRPIPIPITKSYSEGLDAFGYWAAAHGARGGNIRKSVSASMPGWMTKDLINSLYDTRIKADEPVDKEGMEYETTDKKAISNRYLANDVKSSKGKIIASRNDVVDSDLINKLNKHNIKTIHVQSPITDPTPGDGFSAYSYGVDYRGNRRNIGDNIGIVSAHTITEPSLNLAMKSFHTGGKFDITKGPTTLTQFDVLNRILRFTTNVADKSTFASVDGVVKSIKPSSIGGYDVIIKHNDGEEARYINPNNEPTVRIGAKVKKGDIISTGNVTPHDMLRYRGMRDAQKFLVNEISKINDYQVDKRDVETIVRGITNTTRVLHPGSSEYVSGDIAPLSTVEYFNNNNLKEEDVEDAAGDHFAFNYSDFKKHQKITPDMIRKLQKAGIKRVKIYKDQIKHEPFLTPAGIGAKAASSEDWIARLAHNRIRKVLEEGTTQGWRSEITETGHPLPQYIAGVNPK